MNKAYIVIDMINDFVLEEGALPVPKARDILPNIKKKIEELRGKEAIIIYTNDCHFEDDIEFKIWPPHAIEGSFGAEVAKEIKPKKEDYLIKKRKYSAFVGTDLDLLLRELGVEEVILSGVVTDICVIHTAADAYMRGYKIVIYKDQVAALDEKAQEWAIEQMAKLYKAQIR